MIASEHAKSCRLKVQKAFCLDAKPMRKRGKVMM